MLPVVVVDFPGSVFKNYPKDLLKSSASSLISWRDPQRSGQCWVFWVRGFWVCTKFWEQAYLCRYWRPICLYTGWRCKLSKRVHNDPLWLMVSVRRVAWTFTELTLFLHCFIFHDVKGVEKGEVIFPFLRHLLNFLVNWLWCFCGLMVMCTLICWKPG